MLTRRRFIVLALLLVGCSGCGRNATQVFDRNSPAVVTIRTPSGLGSGVLIDPSGVIVTNLHVVRAASSATITLANGDAYDDISVIDVDPRRDLVLLKIKGVEFPIAELGNSDTLEVGQPVFALGAPQGLTLTISEGIISNRRDSGDGYQVLQTTVPISPGSSGGGLFEDAGRLVGITTSKVEAGESLNFAIPINYIKGMLSTSPRWTLAEFNADRGTLRAENVPGSPSRGWADAPDQQTIDEAERGDWVKQSSLAIRYRWAADYVEAAKWDRRAAEQGFTWSQYHLGLAYANGQGVPQDYVLAYFWLDLAAYFGDDQEYVVARDEVARLMDPEQIAEARRMAVEWEPKPER